MNQKIFVCSDIHGFYGPLTKALKAKGFDKKNPDHILMVLGDVFDRGGEAVKLFKFLTKLQKQGRLIYIIGNHELLLRKLISEVVREGCTYEPAHYSNGTVGTLAQFADDKEITRKLDRWEFLNSSERQKLYKSLKPVLDFTYSAINYYEVGKYIFVHGWIPFKSNDDDMYHSNKRVSYYKGWRDLPDNDRAWEEATWLGFCTAFKSRCFEPDKTIVCGHWHCSAYWGDILHERKPFPKKNRPDWLKSFEPAITDEFIAVDACTAYSGIVNVLVFEKTSENQLILLDEQNNTCYNNNNKKE